MPTAFQKPFQTVVEAHGVANPADYTTTDAYVEVPGSRLDALIVGSQSVAYRVAESGAVNGITVKVTASLEGDNWVGHLTLDEVGVVRSAVDTTVAAGAAVYLILTPNQNVGARTAFRFYRLEAKATTAGSQGTVKAVGVAK